MAEAEVHGQQEESANAGVPDAGTQEDSGSSINGEVSQFEAQLRDHPERAVESFKTLQGNKDRALAQLKNADLAIKIAETLGGGDVQTGATEALTRLQRYEQYEQNPQIKKILDDYSLTGQVAGHRALEDDGMEDPFDETAPLKKELQELRQQVAQQGTQNMESRVKSAISDFIEKGDGQHLTPDERSELAQAMVRNVGTWMSNPDTAARVRNLSDSDVELMAIKHLRETGRLESLYERKHLQKLRQRGELATDGPSSVAPGGVSDIPADVDSWDPARVLDWAQKKFS